MVAQPVTQAEPGRDAKSCKVSVKVHSKFQARVGHTKRPSLKETKTDWWAGEKRQTHWTQMRAVVVGSKDLSALQLACSPLIIFQAGGVK